MSSFLALGLLQDVCQDFTEETEAEGCLGQKELSSYNLVVLLIKQKIAT